MIKLFLTSSCKSCRKARRWLTSNYLDYQEINLATSMDRTSVIEILSLTEGGTEDILSTKSRLYKELNTDFSKMSLDQLIKLIEQHPLLLKRPIIINKKSIVVGFNEDNIRKFVPREVRKIQQKQNLATFINKNLES
jgi:regulatory protein spx